MAKTTVGPVAGGVTSNYDIEIRKVTREDVQAVQAIARATFLETFASLNSEENMASYLAQRMSEEQFNRELRNPDSTFFLATVDGQVVGYAKTNIGQAQTEPVGEDAVEIERIYVLQAFHGQAVGQRLFEAALQMAKEEKRSVYGSACGTRTLAQSASTRRTASSRSAPISSSSATTSKRI